MNVLSFLTPNLPNTWKVDHKANGVETPLGHATSTLVASTQPAIIWDFTENGTAAKVRLTLLDQHGAVKIEVNQTIESSPGANGGLGNMGGASAIIKCTYTAAGVANEYRFEGTLLHLP